MKYLGISEGFHDAAWAVVEDGELKFATHSERYTRVKGDKRLPAGFGIKPDEYSIYYEDVELKNRRRAEYGLSDKIAAFKTDTYVGHHEAHMAAAYYTAPFVPDATVVIDAIGEYDTASIWVNGQKVWTSRAEHSDLMLLLARTTPKDEVTKRTDGLSVFLVDLRKSLNHGVTIRPISTMINHATTEVFIDDLRIPLEQRIGEEGKGFRYILDGMNAERILIGAECIGDSRWFIQKASEYAKDRKVFQRPIGQNQGIQFPIAKAYAQSEAADLMVRKAATLFDSGKPCGKEANMAKLLAADASWEAADVCLQTHGGFGFAEEYDIERKFRETRLYRIAPVSTNLILSYLAEHVLGLPRSF